MAKILIVEDEGILAIKVRKDLERMGHEVVGIVDNGEEAINIAGRENPDVILMDIILKGEINGIKATKTINNISKSIIIFMTAHTDGLTLEAAKKTRNSGFLFKPFEPNRLEDIIEASL
ncbi:response regulator [Spirochaetota bacterium]